MSATGCGRNTPRSSAPRSQRSSTRINPARLVAPGARDGNYVLKSLAFVAGLLLFASEGNLGGGLAATSTRTFGAGCLGGNQSGLYIRGDTGTCALLKQPVTNDGFASSATAMCNPNNISCGNSVACSETLDPADKKMSAIWSAYINTSALSRANSMQTSKDGAIGRSSSMICSRFSSGIVRYAVNRSMSATRPRASAASFSSLAARPVASTRRLFDRPRSSVWMWPFHMVPSRTSPVIPMATAASVTADSVKNIRYGGSIQAMMSSTTTETTTNAAHHSPQHSQDAAAASNWSSLVAFIVPRGRYHAGKNRIRTFLLAALVWGVMFALLFAATRHL